MDIGASFKITAGVVGQQAVDALNKSVGGLNEQVSKIPSFAKGAGLALAGLGAGLSVAVFKEKFDGVVESILRVKDAAEKTGSSIEKIGGIVQATKITGDDFNVVEGAIIKMDKALAGADDTAKGAAHALDALGLNIKSLRQMDPADAFTEIAKAMAGFEDGAGKTAIAMDLFGKSGAEVLPFLKDYVEIGEQTSKVTAQQAEDAEAYTRAVLRLNAAKQETYKTIATAVLPVATQFAEALRDMTKEGNGAKDAIKGLAADNSIRDWAQAGAMAVAVLIESLTAVGKAVYAVMGSFQAVYADIKVMGTFLKNGGVVGLAWQSNRDELANAVEERNKVLEEANNRYSDLWNYDGTKLSRNLEERFKRMNAGEKPPEEPPKKSLTGYTSREPTGPKTKKSDPFGDQLDSLGQEAAKLQEQIAVWEKYGESIESARGAQARYQVEQGKFKGLSEKQKIELVMQADAVDQLAQKLKDLKTAAEFDKQTRSIDQNTQALGLNTTQRELAAAGQDLENKGIKQGTELYDQLMQRRREALQRRDDANANPLNGISQAMATLGDEVNNRAGQMKDVLVNAFNGAADALTQFLMTGKANFSDFAKSIIADLLKMIVKQELFNALAAATGSGGGGASIGGSIVSTIGGWFGFSKGGAFDGGLQAFADGGVVTSPTLFKFASGGTMRTGLMGEAGPEAIMPLQRGSDGKLGVKATGGGSSAGITIGSIVVQSDGNATAKDTSGRNAAQLGTALAQAVQAEIIRQKRPGGLLAA